MAQEPTTGLFQWFKIGTSAANAGLGLITGGDMSSNPGTKRILGVGGTEVRVGGMLTLGASVTVAVGGDNQEYIAGGFRASYPRGALTKYKLAGGTDAWGRAYADAVVLDGSLSYKQDSQLSATLNYGAVSIAEAAGSTMPAMAEDILMDWQVAVEIEGVDYMVKSLDLKWNNNVAFKKAGKAKVAGTMRTPDYMTVGIEDLSVDLVLAKPIPTSVDSVLYDCLADDLTIILTATSCNGDALELTLDNLMQQGDNRHSLVDPNTDAEWPYSFMGSSYAGSMTWEWTPGA